MEKTQKHMMNHKFGNQNPIPKNKYTYESIQQLRAKLDKLVIDLSYSTHRFRDRAKFFIVRLSDSLKIIGTNAVLLFKKFKFVVDVVNGSKMLIEELETQLELENVGNQKSRNIKIEKP